MKNVIRWVWSLLEVLIIVYVILITSFILCRNKYGYTQFGDLTFSNVGLLEERNIKTTNKGDLLVIKNSNDIKVGDLIYYYAPFNESYIIKSNVIIDAKDDDYTSLYTLDDGDHTTISNIRVLGKYSNTYPVIGGILNVVESKIGFLFLVLLPIMIVFIYQIYEFIIIIHYERVEEENLNSNKKKVIKEDSDIEIL